MPFANGRNQWLSSFFTMILVTEKIAPILISDELLHSRTSGYTKTRTLVRLLFTLRCGYFRYVWCLLWPNQCVLPQKHLTWQSWSAEIRLPHCQGFKTLTTAAKLCHLFGKVNAPPGKSFWKVRITNSAGPMGFVPCPAYPRNMSVNLGGLAAFVAQQVLYIAQVNTRFQ